MRLVFWHCQFVVVSNALGKGGDVKQSNVTKKMRLCVAAVRLNLTNAELRRRSSESICSSAPT